MIERINLKQILDDISKDSEFERTREDRLTQAEIRTMFSRRERRNAKELKRE
jgi:hypothetical protein